MRLFITIGLISVWLKGFPQLWPGFETGRFSGISSANIRPGGMAPTPYKVDATVLGVHVFTEAKNIFQNEEALNNMASGGFRGLKGYSQLTESKTYVAANLQGPSVIYSLNPKLSLAFAWNSRFLWTSRFTEPGIAGLFDEEAGNPDLEGNGETVTTLFNSWQEFGIGAGGIVWEKNHHSLSSGGFIKMVFGTGNLDIDVNDLDVQTSGDTVEHISFRMTATLSQQMYSMIDEGKLNLYDRTGYGFDIGAEYRFLDSVNHPGANNYRFKAGFSLTDIGQTIYNSALDYSEIKVTGENISLERFRSAPTLRAAVDTLRDMFDIDTAYSKNYKVTLPISLRLYGDYNFVKNLSVFTEFHFTFIQLMQSNLDAPLIFRYNITPRYEDERFGVYLPLNFSNYFPGNAGLALRWKPFIIGSSNLFTFWVYEDRGKALDLYLTIKVPILKKEERVKHLGRKKENLTD